MERLLGCYCRFRKEMTSSDGELNFHNGDTTKRGQAAATAWYRPIARYT